ncbi:hypothetical protein SS50377_24824 [Spironucleus salmonicida]|uniref:Uncharacterized protein n=1 Tax=Spironucleus salmonicida TaxID=348837 RepID=V6LJP5_9EUKA|nr:hypothetical protein SS50377_24824 [Spironucleus salmonicida]|eukprot:EST44747.1 Hypothetical protein SS50377_15367 [Spironucleus salmonicida]
MSYEYDPALDRYILPQPPLKLFRFTNQKFKPSHYESRPFIHPRTKSTPTTTQNIFIRSSQNRRIPLNLDRKLYQPKQVIQKDKIDEFSQKMQMSNYKKPSKDWQQ